MPEGMRARVRTALRMCRLKKIAFVFLWMGMLASQAWAHPHAWIDVLLTPEMTEDGRIAAVRMQWAFDPFYAQVMLEEVQAASSKAEFEARWAALEQDINRTLREAGFHVTADADFGEGTATLRVADGELFLDVHLPLREAVPRLRYQIYESTYYVEMLHAAEQPREWENGCRLQLMPANPSPEKVAEAYALDRNAQGEVNLGRHFAESGVLTCR